MILQRGTRSTTSPANGPEGDGEHLEHDGARHAEPGSGKPEDEHDEGDGVERVPGSGDRMGQEEPPERGAAERGDHVVGATPGRRSAANSQTAAIPVSTAADPNAMGAVVTLVSSSSTPPNPCATSPLHRLRCQTRSAVAARKLGVITADHAVALSLRCRRPVAGGAPAVGVGVWFVVSPFR